MSKLKRSMAVSILFVFALALFSGIFTIPMIKTVQANPGWVSQYSIPSSTLLRGIWGSSSTDVFAVGQTGTYPNFNGTIFHYDGATWTQMAIGTTMRLYGIWGSSSTDVFAVGDSGTILHYNGTAWSTMTSGTSNWLESIWGSSSTDIFVAGVETILHYNGNSWSRYNVSNINLQGIWGSSGNDVFAVGMSGTILHYNGTAWSTMASNYTGWIRSIWGSSGNDVFAVGDSGTILHYNGTDWSKMTSGITNNLRGIWGSSSTDVFAVGDTSILHYDGIGWSSMSFPLDNFYGIWGNSSANIFAVGASRILYYQTTDTFTVTYDANGGSNYPTDSNSPYNDGATVTVLGAGGMTRTGYTFSKWNTQAGGSGTDYLPGATFTIRKNMILYAQWTINTYTLTVNISPTGAGTVTLNPTGGTYNYNTTVTLTESPAAGYRFNNWTGDATGTSTTATVTMTSNKSVTANFIKTYTVTYDANGGSNPPTDSNSPYNDGATVSVLGAGEMSRTGYTFSKWNTQADGSGTEYSPGNTFTISADTTLYAQWTINTYTLTVNISPTGAGTVTLNPTGGTYNYNTTVTLTESPAAGYRFNNWTGDATGTSTTATVTMTSNKSVTANFIKTYTVTYDANGGSNPPTDSNSPYNDGATVSVLGAGEMSRTGYTFSKWNTQADGSGTEYSPGNTFTISADTTLYAQWTINTYTLTVNISPTGAGTVTLNPTGGTYNYNTTVTLTESPAAGYRFNNWTGDATGTSTTATVTMTSNKSVTANFIKTYTVTYDANGGSNPPASATYDTGATVTVASIGSMSRTGYTFSKWNTQADGSGTEYSPGNTFTISADTTLYAQWTINTYTIIASSNSGGTISPSGSVVLNYGSSQTFSITPNTGYHIADVVVDGASQGAISTYTFSDITANHTIIAIFAINTYTITASAGFGGTISPSGIIPATYGDSKSFTIKANSGYFIFKISVDGSPISFNNQLEYAYTFTNVTSNHTIEAQFMKQPDLTPPTLTLPTINGIDLNTPNGLLQVNTPTLTFTVSATDESGIGRLVVKVNGVVQIDKNNLDPTITLQEGMNTVEVTVYDTYGNYTTKSFKVLKDTEGPTIILPSDLPQTVYSNTFTLKGTVVDTASGVSTLTINNKPVIPTLNGNFALQLTLTQGTNTITIEAVDKLNNKTTKTLTLSYTTPQSKTYIITLKVGDPHITINGTEKNIDAQGSKPIIKNSRTLLPIRVLIESLGGTVEWDNTQRKATITLGYNTIELWIGKPTAKVNGVNTPIDSTNSKVVPEIINGRTYLPLRFISENLGASVDWNAKTQTITIYYFK